MKTFVILPARMKSSRLPNKLIKKIGDMTLIEHMITRAKRIKDAIIIVSTDSSIICDYAVKHCVEVLLSKKVFKNGTERCYFTAKTYKAKPSDIIINLQADEFNINVSYINKLIKLLKSFKSASVVTLMYKTSNSDEYSDKNNVKVIADKSSKAITFTRQKLTSVGSHYLIHVGVYAFKFKTLALYYKLGQCNYEKEESLEQLRLIWNNIPVYCVQVENNKSIGINSIRDLKKARSLHGN